MLSSLRASCLTAHRTGKIPLARPALFQQQKQCTRLMSTFPPELKTIQTVDLAYDLHKPNKPTTSNPEGHPILFLHGLFGSRSNNRTMSRALARSLNRSVYALDLRNHGNSPHDARHDYPAMAADVLAFIKAHKISNPTLIGHSMGAKACMALALYEPDIIANVISVDNAPIDAILRTDFASYVRGMQQVERAKVNRQADADKILQEVEPKSLAIRQFLITNLVRETDSESNKEVFVSRVPLTTLGKSLNHMGDFPFKDPSAVRYVKPALFVRGTESSYVADDCIPAIGEFFPRFEMKDVKAGHWLISENPKAFQEAVEVFMEGKA